MADQDKPELQTWQAIADYLGVAVRTAQSYQDKGLPIHRLPGSKSRVWAYKEDIDQWKRQSASEALSPRPDEFPVPPTAPAISAVPPARSRRWIWPVAIAIVLIVITSGFYAFSRKREPPASARVEGASLVVMDRQGKELWRHVFPSQIHEIDPRSPPWFGQLGGDEILTLAIFSSAFNRDAIGETLYCFHQDGSVKWTYTPGKAVRDKKQQYGGAYFINSFRVLPVPSSRQFHIAVSSNHSFSYPNQVSLLDVNGQRLFEYWHSGHLLHMAAVDVDGDGKDELLLGGLNNGYHQATVVVLNSHVLGGASVQPPDDFRQLQGFPVSLEKSAIFFPRTCVSSTQEFNRVIDIRVAEKTIDVVVAESINEHGPQVIYQFDRQLRPLGVYATSTFRNVHRQMEAERKLNHAFSEQEIEKLRDGIRVVVNRF